MNNNDINNYFTLCQQLIDSTLNDWLAPSTTEPCKLHSAIRYSVLSGGKRIRPVLVFATTEAFGQSRERALAAACAVELIHAYSLIHDDLPAMDDDDLRRGLPTCHIKYDEATAILAGDALQAMAFEILCDRGEHSAQARLDMIKTLSVASGSLGMVGGQAIDLDSVGQQISLNSLERMHNYKTGALIEASIVLGAQSTGLDNPKTLHPLQQYARAIGLAFQVQDDILDVTSNTETLGKTQGADEARNKPTYPSLLGLEGAQQKAQALHQSALTALNDLDSLNTSRLAQISEFIINRPR
ncbi:(2E,6E)-farnesyl diphosphate synthase [Alkalimarinus alittae]|uniref:(2E,6E)-farnesyl diphosphate synthase n=1 Tax=Alkalimarinus alittae TaxID=2961619 RepID=A0ABY6N0I4_9ALTE|nr:farnesyl diphosphate synthase [Alkalimarinus alittae]UZE95545.1 (2E,6E)-farnesyl diphosphate synthase [Alkalimarinus alittae]